MRPPQTVPVLGLGPTREVLRAVGDPYLWESLLASRRKKSVMRRRSRTRSPWWRRLAMGCLHWLTQHMQTWQVIYDPDWDVYYDPETHEYFELIEEAISGPQAADFFASASIFGMAIKTKSLVTGVPRITRALTTCLRSCRSERLHAAFSHFRSLSRSLNEGVHNQILAAFFPARYGCASYVAGACHCGFLCC